MSVKFYMRRAATVSFVLVAAITLVLSSRVTSQAPAQSPSAASPAPTFNQNVAPILYANRGACHPSPRAPEVRGAPPEHQ